MLKEFALTPQVFDPSAASDAGRWREHMRMLAMALFRVPAVPPIVVSGLYWQGDTCAWQSETTKLIASISDAESRRDAQALFTQISKHLVPRPPGPGWPGDEESGWAEEAAGSHRLVPLDRVLAQRVENVPEDVPRAALASITDSDFWNLLHSPAPAASDVSEAIAPLALILRHSDLLVLTMPYETCEDFTLECIRRACQRPSGARRPIIHVHRNAPPNIGAKISWVRSKLAAELNGAEVHIYFWPKPYRERRVFGCRLADVGSGKLRPAVRWGVSLTHVWGESQRDDVARSTATLLPSTEAASDLQTIQSQAAASDVEVRKI